MIFQIDHTLMRFVQMLGGSEGTVWNSIMNVFFAIATFLCEELFVLILIFVLYWAINKKLAHFAMISLFASVGLNGMLKTIIARPRPFLTSEFGDLRYVRMENFFVDTANLGTSFSFPSGHSQLAGSIFMSMAIFIKKKWAYIVFPILILLVMASRVYLGVHYPTDTIIGGMLGVLVALVISKIMLDHPERKYILFFAALLLVIINIIIEGVKGSPNMGDTAKMIGTAIGAILGIYIEERSINFRYDVAWYKKLVRVLAGLIIVIGIKEGFKILFGLITDNATALIYLGALRYFLMGIFVAAGWPYVFTKLKF